MESFFTYIQKSSFTLMLFGVTLATGGMLLWPFVARLAGRGAREVDSTAAVQLINRRDALVLDVRDGGDFAQGHIPNARHIPMGQLATRLKELEKFKSRPIVVDSGSGTNAGAACKLLAKEGFTEVVALRGGLGAWQQAALPVSKKTK